jgi:dTDP-4-dehydrorhamnose 3,5-epimerase
MDVVETGIPGAFAITPKQFADERGTFLEWYRFDRLADAVGRRFHLRQGNLSVSRRGVLRGVHLASVPAGQAKYVTVVAGAAIDFFVDLRVGSPTFGRSGSVHLDAVDRHAVFLSEGLGHAFLALEDDTTVSYLVNDVYNPRAEFGLDPLDPALGLQIPLPVDELVLSEKDSTAPTLAQAQAAGLLPTWEACVARYEEDAA